MGSFDIVSHDRDDVALRRDGPWPLADADEASWTDSIDVAVALIDDEREFESSGVEGRRATKIGYVEKDDGGIHQIMKSSSGRVVPPWTPR